MTDTHLENIYREEPKDEGAKQFDIEFNCVCGYRHRFDYHEDSGKDNAYGNYPCPECDVEIDFELKIG